MIELIVGAGLAFGGVVVGRLLPRRGKATKCAASWREQRTTYPYGRETIRCKSPIDVGCLVAQCATHCRKLCWARCGLVEGLGAGR